MTESMSGLAVAMASLKAAKEIAESDPAAFQKRQTEFVSKLLDAYGAVFKAQEEQTALLNRIEKLVSIEAIKERYKLASLGAANVVAYAPKHPEPGEPPHYLCANCLHAGKVSYLQQTLHGPSVHKYRCNTCTEELRIDTGRSRQTSALPYRGGGGGPNSWMSG
jgi:hypothetical protein